MALLKQRFQNKFENVIKVFENGKQLPEISFKIKSLSSLEIFFNRHEFAKDLVWLTNLIEASESLKSYSFDVSNGNGKSLLLESYCKENDNLLSQFILDNSNENNFVISDSDFILELCKYYNAETLFSVFGCLESKFDQIKVIEEDQVAVTIRSSVSLVTEYFTDKTPLLINTEELLFYFKCWHSFIDRWKQSEIIGLRYNDVL